MAYAYRLFPQHGVFVVRAEGTITGTDIARTTIQMLDDPRFDPALDGLYDYRGITSLAVGPEEMRQIASAVLDRRRHLTRPSVRLAIVVTDEATADIVELYRHLTRDVPQEIRQFRRMRPALQWLGLAGDLRLAA